MHGRDGALADERLVFGATAPRLASPGSLGDLARDPRLNHAVRVESGLLAVEAGEILRDFFRERR